LLSWLGQSPEFIRTIFELTIIPGFIGVFMVTTLNAMRARIGQSQQGIGQAYGVFYFGIAPFSV
jgi:Flp pilus assembly pilin Flp